MIKFTIKTLDACNHVFEVDDEITVEQLKDKVHEIMGIEPGMQRLIFCGRVLQDDTKLADYNVHEKVVHLVQRPPPSPGSRQTVPSTSSASNTASFGRSRNLNEAYGFTPQQVRRLMSMVDDPGIPLSPTLGRLEFVRRMINNIRSEMRVLRLDGQDEADSGAAARRSGNRSQGAENDDPAGSRSDEDSEEETEERREPRPTRAPSSRRRAMRAGRPRHARPRDLAQLIDELGDLYQDFVPYRDSYVHLLRDASNTERTEEERQREQRVVDSVTDIMHSFAHAYHAVSDLRLHVGLRNGRLLADANAVRHPLPVQAHINLFQPNRRPQYFNAASSRLLNLFEQRQNQSEQATSDTSSNSQGGQSNETSARNEGVQNQSGTSQPDPVTYQVEIETRVPVAVALDNALLNPLANNQRAQTNQPQPPNQPPNQPQPQPNQPPRQPRTFHRMPSPRLRRRLTFDDFDQDRILRELNHSAGVEILVRMEEIPHLITPNVAGSNATNAAGGAPAAGTGPGGVQQMHLDNGVLVGPFPVMGAPTVDVVNNIVNYIMRNGIASGLDPTNATANAEQQPPPTFNAQNPEQPQGQPAWLSNFNMRRGATGQVQAVPMYTCIYDPFLHCDSGHARRHVQRRREQYQRNLANQERIMADRFAAQNIETLRERAYGLTEVNIGTMVRLLNADPSPEAWMNALMVTIARELFLTEMMHVSEGDPGPEPFEFRPLRAMLRSYIQNVLERSGCEDGENAFEGAADFIVGQHREFIQWMQVITPVRTDVHIFCSIRTLVRARLPAIIAAVMSDSSGDSVSSRFYSVFTDLFSDLCLLLTYCFLEGREGLRIVYRNYMEEFVKHCDTPVQELLLTLSFDNLNMVFNRHSEYVNSIRPYIVDSDGVPLALHDLRAQMTQMDTATPKYESTSASPTAPSPVPSTSDERQNLSERQRNWKDKATASKTETSDNGETQRHKWTRTNPTSTVTSSGPSRHTELDIDALLNSLRPVNLPPGTPSPTPASPTPPPPSPPPQPQSSDSQNRPGSRDTSISNVFGREMVPVLERDRDALAQARPTAPYSDAYLTGMPARKRRCIRESRPPVTFDAMLNVTFRELDDASTPEELTEDATLRSSFRDQIRAMTRSRATEDDDYDRSRFVAVDNFLDPRKVAKQEDDSEDNST